MKPLLTANKITEYLDECISIFDMVDGVKTIGDFVKRVEMLSHKFALDINNPTVSEQDKINSFKGDMLEILAEIFWRIYAAEEAVGIVDYMPIPLTEDFGVDGVGTNPNGDKCVAQVKYRANPLDTIHWDDLAKTDSMGLRHYDVLKEKDYTVFLFTTCAGATSACQEVLGNVLREINRNIIAGKIDLNQTFWKQAEELILFTLDNL
jgi:hypothetical protein